MPPTACLTTVAAPFPVMPSLFPPAITAAEPFFSPVDSARFGLRIGRVKLTDLAALPAALSQSQHERLRLLFVRCPTGAYPLVHRLEAAGARLMDTLLYYRRRIASRDLFDELKPNLVRPFREGDWAGVERVARASFADYQGHYHADHALDSARSDEAYVEWTLHCCRQRDASLEVLVAEDSSGAPCGFFVVRLNSPQEGEGWLAAVAPEAEGRGLYWSLLVHALRWCQDRKAGRMIVSTQITNTATQKTYGRLGFDLQASYYTFHLWLPATSA